MVSFSSISPPAIRKRTSYLSITNITELSSLESFHIINMNAVCFPFSMQINRSEVALGLVAGTSLRHDGTSHLELCFRDSMCPVYEIPHDAWYPRMPGADAVKHHTGRIASSYVGISRRVAPWARISVARVDSGAAAVPPAPAAYTRPRGRPAPATQSPPAVNTPNNTWSWTSRPSHSISSSCQHTKNKTVITVWVVKNIKHGNLISTSQEVFVDAKTRRRWHSVIVFFCNISIFYEKKSFLPITSMVNSYDVMTCRADTFCTTAVWQMQNYR